MLLEAKGFDHAFDPRPGFASCARRRKIAARYTSIIQPSMMAFRMCHKKCVPMGHCPQIGMSIARNVIDKIRTTAPAAIPFARLGSRLRRTTA